MKTAGKTITREQLEEWVAQFDEDGGCDATDRQLEALIRQSLAAMDSEPVAWTDEEELRDANESGIGYLFGIERDANKFADPRRQIMLYRHAQQPVAPVLKCYACQGSGRMHELGEEPGDCALCNGSGVLAANSAQPAKPAPVAQCVTLGDSPYDVPHSMPSNLRELIAEEIGILFSDDDAQSVWDVCRRAAMLNGGKS